MLKVSKCDDVMRTFRCSYILKILHEHEFELSLATESLLHVANNMSLSKVSGMEVTRLLQVSTGRCGPIEVQWRMIYPNDARKGNMRCNVYGFRLFYIVHFISLKVKSAKVLPW